MIPLKIAQLLLTEGAKTLTDASEATKAALVVAYLDARDWDVEVTFNMREFRDAAKHGQTHQQVVEAEIFAWSETAYGPQIEFELERLRDEAAREDRSAA